jgi:hypothetical protein
MFRQAEFQHSETSACSIRPDPLPSQNKQERFFIENTLLSAGIQMVSEAAVLFLEQFLHLSPTCS